LLYHIHTIPGFDAANQPDLKPTIVYFLAAFSCVPVVGGKLSANQSAPVFKMPTIMLFLKP
jgi:hypothetical protein